MNPFTPKTDHYLNSPHSQVLIHRQTWCQQKLEKIQTGK